ncbi:hypothetical protein BKA57DRAFT_452925 [Linnemannia elongata]|nr:hypothetical protein BKA57DRAFT_479319 [Linnemannia elongata]KAH7036946.1 hypothetical protein BKA57DRAFT_474600 [Linnemannia elongata]KAH7048048.1 hypothetical protein BKA57DRAFT_464019 [Linnemannia elongata]KAH7055018.1 hypothetical protein BKA57DRAFT_452782 [Linnemannia elongata]KAH7055057.1 hypothetical protein BKA57DRAFT_452925 [Linnemannia elongata]
MIMLCVASLSISFPSLQISPYPTGQPSCSGARLGTPPENVKAQERQPTLETHSGGWYVVQNSQEHTGLSLKKSRP